MSESDHMEQMPTYISRDGGNIKYEFLPGKRDRRVRFTWGALFEI